MNAAAPTAFDDRLPTELEVSNAEALRQIVASQIKDDDDTVINVADGTGTTHPITLSPALAHAFLDILRMISAGRGFRLLPLETKLTTQQAADLLNVSRPHLIKVLERGDIEFETVGRHRRIKAADLLAYKDQRDTTRRDALAAMAEEDGQLL